jgi:hypothetical protein
VSVTRQWAEDEAPAAGSRSWAKQLRRSAARAGAASGALIALAVLPGCDGHHAAAGCPGQPSLPSYGKPAPRAPMTSVNLELGKKLMFYTVRDALQTPQLPRGADVAAVDFQQTGSGSDELNLIAIDLRPWVKVEGHRVYGPRYVLRVKIVPYLITRATIPDRDTRREILGSIEPSRCQEIRNEITQLEAEIASLQEDLKTAGPGEKPAIIAAIKRTREQIVPLRAEAAQIGCKYLKTPPLDEGAVVRMEFYDLSRGKVRCTDSKFNVLDKKILRAIYDGFVVKNGRITTTLSSRAVNGVGTNFKDQMAAVEASDPSQWDIYRASDMAYIGRVQSVTDNATLKLESLAAVALKDEPYVAVRRPLVLPVDMLSAILTPTKPAVLLLNGINIGSKGGLKVGFDLGASEAGLSTLEFSPAPSIDRNDDWRITASDRFIEAAALAQVNAMANMEDQPPPYELEKVSVGYNVEPPALFDLNVRMKVRDYPCNAVPYVLEAPITPYVNKGLDGKPYLIVHFNRLLSVNPDWNLLCTVGIRGNVLKIYQRAGGCSEAVGPALRFNAFGEDYFEATDIDVDAPNASFSVGGRSEFVDKRLDEEHLPPRPSIEACAR